MRKAPIQPSSKPTQSAMLPMNGPKRMPDMIIMITVGGMIVIVFMAMIKM